MYAFLDVCKCVCMYAVRAMNVKKKRKSSDNVENVDEDTKKPRTKIILIITSWRLYFITS